jgi:hypothetical protein
VGNNTNVSKMVFDYIAGWTKTLNDLKRHRDNEVAFLLAKLTLEKYFRQDNEQKTDRPSVHRFDADVKGWLFPQVLSIAKRWLTECVTCKDNTFPQLLLLVEFAPDAADRIYKAIVESAAGTHLIHDVAGRPRIPIPWSGGYARRGRAGQLCRSRAAIGFLAVAGSKSCARDLYGRPVWTPDVLQHTHSLRIGGC